MYTSPPDGEYRDVPSFEEVHVTFHYYRYDENYENWNLWIWNPGKDGQRFGFLGEDEFGKTATVKLADGDGIEELGFILRKSEQNNDWAGQELNDRFVTSFDEEGKTHVWLVQGQQRVYEDPNLIDTTPRILEAEWDEMNQVLLTANFPIAKDDMAQDGLSIQEDHTLSPQVKAVEGKPNQLKLNLDKPINFQKEYALVSDKFGTTPITVGAVVRSESFDEHYFYEGDDLGNTYTKGETKFRVWAPTARVAQLVLYDSWQDTKGEIVPMEEDERGTWTASLQGDQDGQIYNYRVQIGNDWNEAVDPYVRAVTVNGDRGVVVNLDKTDPKKWNEKKPKFTSQIDAIIYELHVRDLSIQKESGITNKGKFLGVTETGTRGPDGMTTGLDFIKDLGVSHVQFLPIYDYRTVDETRIDDPQYNWGYDPKNYNVPEGSYSTDPYNPTTRITELKDMIQTLHDNDLRVVMDVVYNHVFSAEESSFQKIVPGYYFRYNEHGELANGTGVGNDVASERNMMQKFIIDSVTYWVEEYNMDGFRFDLMGILDTETMNKVREAVDKIDPSIVIIGEGWDLGTPLDAKLKANQKNAEDMPSIGQFNDALRDGIKGSVWDDKEPGFVNGKQGTEDFIRQSIAGGLTFDEQMATYRSPEQVVQYVEAHDNLTLWDKLKKTNPDATEEELKRMHKLATSIVLTSQGVSFLHAGQEFMRTKDGDPNSYQSPDGINQLDWQRRAEFSEEVNYVKGLIELRNTYKSFRMPTKDKIEENLQFLDTPAGTVGYTLDAKANKDQAKTLVVLHNANKEDMEVQLSDKGTWQVLINSKAAGTKPLRVLHEPTVSVPAQSTLVLRKP